MKFFHLAVIMPLGKATNLLTWYRALYRKKRTDISCCQTLLKREEGI